MIVTTAIVFSPYYVNIFWKTGSMMKRVLAEITHVFLNFMKNLEKL